MFFLTKIIQYSHTPSEEFCTGQKELSCMGYSILHVVLTDRFSGSKQFDLLSRKLDDQNQITVVVQQILFSSWMSFCYLDHIEQLSIYGICTISPTQLKWYTICIFSIRCMPIVMVYILLQKMSYPHKTAKFASYTMRAAFKTHE